MAFSESWRKRNACERCRRHKVRCEYEDPSSQRCIRCAKSSSECVVKDRGNRKGGDNTSLRGVPDQNDRSEDPKNDGFTPQSETSPLLRAAHDGLYDFEEMGVFYDLFIKSGNNIPVCDAPNTLCELDKQYPLTAFMLVTCVSLSMSSKNAPQRYKLIEGLVNTGMGERQVISFDSHSALLLACRFLLPFSGKGLIRLNLLHGSMLALQLQNGFGTSPTPKFSRYPGSSDAIGDTYLRLYEQTGSLLMSFSLNQKFESISPIAALYNATEVLPMTCDKAPLVIYAIFTDYRTTLAMIEQTSTLSDLINVCAMGYEKLSTPCPLSVVYSAVAQLKLAAASLSWAIRALGAVNLDPYKEFYETLITHAIQVCTKNLLADFQYAPTPILMNYLASSTINILWLIRVYCFASNLDIDVPVIEFCDLITSRWQAMASCTYTGRTSFVGLLHSSDLTRLELGYYSECSARVEGSGKMDTFFIYLMGHKGNPPLYEAAINSADLRELMRLDNARDRKPIGHMAMVPSSYSEFEEMFTWVIQGGISGLW